MNKKTVSQPIADLEALGIRLRNDGYPTVFIEAAVIRMTAMEELVVDNATELNYLRYFFEEADFGPAHEDVVMIMNEGYNGEFPEGY